MQLSEQMTVPQMHPIEETNRTAISALHSQSEFDVNLLAVEDMCDAPQHDYQREGRGERTTRITEERLHADLVPETPNIVHIAMEGETDIVHRVHEDCTQTEDKQRVDTKAFEELVPTIGETVLEALPTGGRRSGVMLRQTDIQYPNQDAEEQTCQSAGYKDIRC